MICPPCTVGGEHNKVANEAPSDWFRDLHQTIAKTNHLSCPGGTHCNCQHVVGMVVK